MIEVTMFKTEHDGQVHANKDAARRHAESQYNLEAQRIADEILDQPSGRANMVLWVKQNIDRFVRLHAIREDIQLRDTTRPV